MGSTSEEIKQRKTHLNKIFILFDYLFLGVIVGNIGTIFINVFSIQDNIFKILGIFFIRFMIPLIGLIRIGKKHKDKIIKNGILRMIIPKILFSLNIIMGIFILVCVAVNIQNSVIDPENPINVFNRIQSLF